MPRRRSRGPRPAPPRDCESASTYAPRASRRSGATPAFPSVPQRADVHEVVGLEADAVVVVGRRGLEERRVLVDRDQHRRRVVRLKPSTTSASAVDASSPRFLSSRAAPTTSRSVAPPQRSAAAAVHSTVAATAAVRLPKGLQHLAAPGAPRSGPRGAATARRSRRGGRGRARATKRQSHPRARACVTICASATDLPAPRAPVSR